MLVFLWVDLELVEIFIIFSGRFFFLWEYERENFDGKGVFWLFRLGIIEIGYVFLVSRLFDNVESWWKVLLLVDL